jgi:ankyrin repeat protein
MKLKLLLIAWVMLTVSLSVLTMHSDEENLIWAVTINNYEQVDALLQKNVNVDCCDSTLWTSLHIAARLGRSKIVERLLASNASVNGKIFHQLATPLHHACQGDYHTVVKLLLEHKANVNDIDKDQQTPLHIAVLSPCWLDNDAQIIRYLLQYDADIDAMDLAGKTPLDYASDHAKKYSNEKQLGVQLITFVKNNREMQKLTCNRIIANYITNSNNYPIALLITMQRK